MEYMFKNTLWNLNVQFLPHRLKTGSLDVFTHAHSFQSVIASKS